MVSADSRVWKPCSENFCRAEREAGDCRSTLQTSSGKGLCVTAGGWSQPPPGLPQLHQLCWFQDSRMKGSISQSDFSNYSKSWHLLTQVSADLDLHILGYCPRADSFPRKPPRCSALPCRLDIKKARALISSINAANKLLTPQATKSQLCCAPSV